MSLLREPATGRPSQSDPRVLFEEARARRRRLRVIRAVIVTALAGVLLAGLAAGGVFTRGPAGDSRTSAAGSRAPGGSAGLPGVAYVTSATGILPVDLRGGTTGRPITVPEIGKGGVLALAPDGKSAYVTSGRGLVPIDLTTRTPGPPIPVPVPTGISSMAIARDGRTAYVTTVKGVDSVNLASGTLAGSFSLPLATAPNLVIAQ